MYIRFTADGTVNGEGVYAMFSTDSSKLMFKQFDFFYRKSNFQGCVFVFRTKILPNVSITSRPRGQPSRTETPPCKSDHDFASINIISKNGETWDQDQDSLLVKRRNDNHSPVSAIREISP